MKEYRLAAWPQLRSPFDRIAHRRMASDMSNRHMTQAQLVECSGVRRNEVRDFLDMLESDGLLDEREATAPESMFGPLGGWLRRTLTTSESDR
jgi:transcription initiation factor IIE alpha subunit